MKQYLDEEWGEEMKSEMKRWRGSENQAKSAENQICGVGVLQKSKVFNQPKLCTNAPIP